MARQIKIIFWETLEVVLVSLAIILPIRYFLVQPFFVRGQSMVPMFTNGDYLVIDEISYRFRTPERGEVVVFKFPKDTSEFYIKRIIGLPGETVEIRGGGVVISNASSPAGFSLDESYLPHGLRTEPKRQARVTLGAGEYFVLGDNRTSSYDSRDWGPVPRSDIIGRVWLRPWPLSDTVLFEAPLYE